MECINWPSWIQAIATVAIIFVTAFYTYYAREQVCQMKKAVDESRKMREGSDKSTSKILIEMGKQSNAMQKFATTLEKTDQTSRLRDRAFVSIDPNFIYYPSPQKTVISVQFVVGNTGNIPAQNLTVKYACKVYKGSENIVDPWKQMEKELSVAPIATTIGPKQAIPFQAREWDVSTGIVESIIKGDNVVFIVATAEYADEFNPSKIHITHMNRRLHLDPAGGSRFSYNKSHNCTDEYCN